MKTIVKYLVEHEVNVQGNNDALDIAYKFGH